MIKFIHTADIHFGMENYGRIDAKTGIHSRLLDFEKAFNFCVDYAIEQDIDFFLFAGDAYKTAYPSPTHQRLFLQCLLRLYKAKIPIIMVVGNHDNPLSFGKAHALEIFGQLPLDGFHVISKPTAFVLQTKSGPVQIVGIPWPTRNAISLNMQYNGANSQELTQHISNGVGKIISSLAAQLDENLPAVLSGHLTVADGIFSGSEKRAIYGTDPIFLTSQLAIKPFDYVALGHLHRFQNLNKSNQPPVIYSGSIERIDFGERKEDKGFCLVKLISKEKTEYEFIKTPTRPFIQIEVKISDDNLNQTEQIINEISKINIQNAIVKILYHLPIGKKDRVDTQALQQALHSAWYVVGIIPIRAIETKERRANLKIDMDLAKLLSNYFDTKPELQKQKQTLISKALELQQEISDQENN